MDQLQKRGAKAVAALWLVVAAAIGFNFLPAAVQVHIVMAILAVIATVTVYRCGSDPKAPWNQDEGDSPWNKTNIL